MPSCGFERRSSYRRGQPLVGERWEAFGCPIHRRHQGQSAAIDSLRWAGVAERSGDLEAPIGEKLHETVSQDGEPSAMTTRMTSVIKALAGQGRR